MHILHSVPGARGSANMKILLLFLNISLALSEKLDRTYLPPPGSPLSGGRPGDINLPSELSNTKYFSEYEGLSKIPELVIGIDRVSSNQAGDTFDDISTHKPKISGNVNYSTSKQPTTIFIQSSPFPKEVSTTNVPEFNYNPGYLHNSENHPSISILNDKNRVDLPSYKDIYKTDEVISITVPPTAISEIGKNDVYKHMPQSDSYKDTPLLDPDNQKIHISSTTSPNYLSNFNKNITTKYYSTASQYSATTPIVSIKGKPSMLNFVNNRGSERVQAPSDRQAVILNYDQTINPDGYTYSYDTSNVIHGEEEGSAIDGVKAKGSYSYIGDDGLFYRVDYTADENGFLPKGAHLPTAPPIPDAILKVIEQAAKDKEAGIYDDGSYNEEKYGYKNLEKKHPEASNIIDGEKFSPDNSHQFDENGLQIPVRINHNEYTDIDLFRDNSDNENENSISKDIVTNKKEDPLTNSDLEFSISYKSDETRPQTSSSYEYFPPQSYNMNKLKSIPPQVFEKDQDLHIHTNKSNTEKLTAKPFLTPYVSRKDDDLEIKDYNEQLGNKQQDNDFDEQSLTDKLDENYEDYLNDFDEEQNEYKMKETSLGNEPNDKLLSVNEDLNTREYISEDISEQYSLQNGDETSSNYDLLPSDKEGYFYQNINKPFITLNPRVSSANSTAATRKFPPELLVRPSSFQMPTISRKTPLIDSSTKFPITYQTTYTRRPGDFINGEPMSINADNIFGNTVSLTTTPKTTQYARPGYARFGMQYKPTTENPRYSGEYNRQSNTKNIIGEDFTGPKQPQQFDPNTGYYY